MFTAPLGTTWLSPAFEGDREIAARVMPAHWLSVEIWYPHIAAKTAELVRSEPFWSTFTEVVDELERLEVS